MIGTFHVVASPEPTPAGHDLTTPTPVYVEEPPPARLGEGLPRLERHEVNRLRAAAVRATQIYPAPVGRLVQRELTDAADFGYRFANGCLIADLVAEVMRPHNAN